MYLRSIKLHNFVANLSVCVLSYKRKLEKKPVSYMTKRPFHDYEEL